MQESQLSTSVKPFYKNNKFILILMLLVLGLCWSGILDREAEGMIDSALVDAAVIFGSARVLNGVISILQSIDVGVVFMNVSPFELLDPVNDLVERFSEVMTFSLASLALQKILLMITSNSIFNVLVTVSAVSVVWSVFFFRQAMGCLIKVFCILTLLRLALFLTIFANSIVDTAFLKDSVDENQKQIAALQLSLSSVSGALMTGEGGVETSSDSETAISLRDELMTTNKHLSAVVEDMQALIVEIEERQQAIDDFRSQQSVMWRANPFSKDDAEIEVYKEEVSALSSQLKTAENLSEVLIEQISIVTEKLECEEKRAAGGSCSISEWAKNGLSIAAMKAKVQNAMDSASNSVSNIIDMIALMVLKSILLPLLFWWIIYRSIKWLWAIPAERFGDGDTKDGKAVVV